MSTITNGSITIERTLRPADFEAKKASVTLSFAIDEGEDAAEVVKRIGAMAHDRMLAMLRRPEQVVEIGANQLGRPIKPPAAVQEPTAAENPPSVSAVSQSTSAGQTPSDISAPTPEITDAHLDAAVRKARSRNVQPDQIKGAIFALTQTVGASMKSLDQAKRPLLVAALDGLTAS